MATVIRRISIANFGAVDAFDAILEPQINTVHTGHVPEVSAALEILLWGHDCQRVPHPWVGRSTRIEALVEIDGSAYTISVVPKRGRLTLQVADGAGKIVTDFYKKLLSHCPEQDAVEKFDGGDRQLPRYLCHYRANQDQARPEQMATRAFRAYLRQYIQNFRPERINSRKDYHVALDPPGEFRAFLPDYSEEVFLSETEEKLFLYTCFLNLAEFWVGFEQIRDLHHEKKPLVIQNFLEFLDASTDVSGLLARTLQLERQVIILTPPEEQ